MCFCPLSDREMLWSNFLNEYIVNQESKLQAMRVTQGKEAAVGSSGCEAQVVRSSVWVAGPWLQGSCAVSSLLKWFATQGLTLERSRLSSRCGLARCGLGSLGHQFSDL